MKSVEECTLDELKEILKTRLVSSLFEGTLNSYVHSSIELSIRWYIAAQKKTQE